MAASKNQKQVVVAGTKKASRLTRQSGLLALVVPATSTLEVDVLQTFFCWAIYFS